MVRMIGTAQSKPKTVLVAGATGRLGGLVPLLLARGHDVRAMTRDPFSPAAEALRAAGAQVVQGDFDDPASIAGAATGVHVVVATGTAHRAGPDGELRHGLNLASAAVAAGVGHLVYVSGDGAAPDSPVPLFRVKFEVEERLRSIDVPHTILAPVYLMENLFNPWNLLALQAGTFPSPISVGRQMQQLALADLIAFAALAVERPGDFEGARVRLASDELNAEQAAEALSAITQRDLTAERIAREELPPGLHALFDWLEETGHDADVDGLRHMNPEVGWRRFADWADEEAGRFRELCPHQAPVAP
jgi:uncharacterized protein YbjT (DUF2867 family)